MVIINNKGVDCMEHLINWKENNKQKQLAEDKKNGTTKSWRERPLRRRRDTSGL